MLRSFLIIGFVVNYKLGSDARRSIGGNEVRVAEIAVFFASQTFGARRAGRALHGVPPHVRHLEAVEAEFFHRAGEDAQTAHAGGFLARFEEHLHPETDAEKGPAGGDELRQHRVEALGAQRFHAVAETPYAGQDAAVETFQFGGVSYHVALGAQKLQRLGDRAEVAHVVIDQRDAHSRRNPRRKPPAAAGIQKICL